MAKRKKCEHGNNAIYVEGCAYCAMDAMGALRLMRMIGVSEVAVLAQLLRIAFGSQEAFDKALAEAKKAVAEERLEQASKD